MWTLLPVLELEFLVMFHFMFVHYTFSLVWVAEWPPFEKWLPALLAICSHSLLYIFVIFIYIPFWF